MYDYKKLDFGRLAELTGGRHYEPATLDQKDLAKVLRSIATEISMENVVGYQPEGAATAPQAEDQGRAGRTSRSARSRTASARSSAERRRRSGPRAPNAILLLRPGGLPMRVLTLFGPLVLRGRRRDAAAAEPAPPAAATRSSTWARTIGPVSTHERGRAEGLRPGPALVVLLQPRRRRARVPRGGAPGRRAWPWPGGGSRSSTGRTSTTRAWTRRTPRRPGRLWPKRRSAASGPARSRRR